MLTLSEGHQGYPQIITVEASVDSRGIDVTAQDVLRTIHEDMRKPFPGRELSELCVEERAGINATFGETCGSEEELSEGPRRIGYLGGRDKIQILPKFAPDGGELTPTSTLPTHALHSGRIFVGLTDPFFFFAFSAHLFLILSRNESRVARPSRNSIL
jgi:hypothetical protein